MFHNYIFYNLHRIRAHIMKHKRNLLVFLLLAIAITSFGYIVDTDLTYQEWSKTFTEFSIFTIIIFSIQCAAYGLFLTFKTIISSKN
jgi:hypothetical protein